MREVRILSLAIDLALLGLVMLILARAGSLAPQRF